MSKWKKAIILLAILLAIILSFIGGQTFSKYISEVKGSGIAEVARWSFKVNGQTEEVQSINLASTCNNETLIGNKIAPGTEGAFNIVVDGNDSDVGIDYKIDFENETSKPQNLKFIYNDVEYDSITKLENGGFEYGYLILFMNEEMDSTTQKNIEVLCRFASDILE